MSTALNTIEPSAVAKLRQAAALAEVEIWRPNDGDILEGELIGSRQASGPFGTQRQALVRQFDGETRALWLNDWLLTALRAQSAELGDLVSVKLLGKGQSARGSTFNRYLLTVVKP